MIIEWVKRRKPSILGMVSGAVADLVAITPASDFVGALLTGVFAVKSIGGVEGRVVIQVVGVFNQEWIWPFLWGGDVNAGVMEGYFKQCPEKSILRRESSSSLREDDDR
jgi:ammonia channel protein AmtB